MSVLTTVPSPFRGSPDQVKTGNLRRTLDPVGIVELTQVAGAAVGIFTRRVRLKGLSRGLALSIGVGIPGLEAAAYPANPGTMQITPANKTVFAEQVPYRPVFQDPTSTPDVNDPMPRNIPYSWEGLSIADEAWIDVVINGANWLGATRTGIICVTVVLEYVGAWWNENTIKWMLGRVTMAPENRSPLVMPTVNE